MKRPKNDKMLVPTGADTQWAKQQLTSGRTLNGVLADLRAKGFGLVASTIILHKATGEPLNAAKLRVARSATWSDRTEAWNENHERTIEQLKDIVAHDDV